MSQEQPIDIEGKYIYSIVCDECYMIDIQVTEKVHVVRKEEEGRQGEKVERMKEEKEGGEDGRAGVKDGGRGAVSAEAADAAAVAGVKEGGEKETQREDGQLEKKLLPERMPHLGVDSKKNRFGQHHQARFARHQAGFPGQHSFMNALRPQAGAQHGLVLSDNSEILKVINMNKMQHQYI